jgi:hypothetical protein
MWLAGASQRGLAMPTSDPRRFVKFVNAGDPRAAQQPVDGLRFDGSVLRHIDGNPLAHHRDNRWHLFDGGQYWRLECAFACIVWFDGGNGRRSRDFGPYRTFSAVDGILCGEQATIASSDDERNEWYAFPLQGHWPSVVVVPKAGPD